MAISVSTLGTYADKSLTGESGSIIGNISASKDDQIIVATAGDVSPTTVTLLIAAIGEIVNTTGSSGFYEPPGGKFGQTFTPAADILCGQVKLHLYCPSGTPTTTNAPVGIYATTGSPAMPTGAALISGTVNCTGLTATPAWITCTFSGTYTLLSGVKYALVFENNDPSVNIGNDVSASSVYSGGNVIGTATGSWPGTDYSAYDLQFEIDSGPYSAAMSNVATASNTGNVVADCWIGKVPYTTTVAFCHITQTGTQATAATVYKATGLDTSSPFDKSGPATGTGTTATSGTTGTLTQADELGIGIVSYEGPDGDTPGTFTTGTGYISGNEQRLGSTGGGPTSNVTCHTSAEVLSATTAQLAEITSGPNRDWAAIAVTFKGAPTGPAPNKSDTVTVTDTPTVRPQISATSSADSITVTDTVFNIVIYDPNIIQVEPNGDTVTVGDTPTARPEITPVRGDTVTLSESSQARPVIGPAKSDTVTVTDTPTARPELKIAKSDTVTVSESSQARPVIAPTKSDTVTVTDTISGVKVSDLQITKSDTVTVSENNQARPVIEIATSDAVSLGEPAPQVSIETVSGPQVNVNDTITVTDTPTTPAVQINAATSDLATLNEQIDARPQINAATSDLATLGESLVVRPAIEIAKAETVTVGESSAVQLDPLEITASDAVTTGEYTNITIAVAGAILISVSDGVAVSESSQARPELNISTSDTVTTGEPAPTVSISVPGLIDISVSDTVTMGESSQARPELKISTGDTVTMGESSSVSIGTILPVSISVSDTVSLGESSQARPELKIAVNDSVSLGESWTVWPIVAPQAGDTVTVSDAVSITLDNLLVNVSDLATITDSPTVRLEGKLYIQVSDTVTVGEQVLINYYDGLRLLTLGARDTLLTLEDRATELTLQDRATELTLQD